MLPDHAACVLAGPAPASGEKHRGGQRSETTQASASGRGGFRALGSGSGHFGSWNKTEVRELVAMPGQIRSNAPIAFFFSRSFSATGQIRRALQSSFIHFQPMSGKN
jgi:hypothetical protein